MSLEEIVQLFEAQPAFRALKIETFPAGPKYTAVLEATGSRLHVSGGWGVQQLMEALRRGVHAFIPSTMEPIYCRIFNNFWDGREEAAQTLFDELLPVLAFAHSHIDVALPFFKRLRVREGVFASEAVRPPAPPLDPWQSQEAERLIDKVLKLQARVKPEN
jgi:4-hydroxy-tetrahydrodipicolinate synthase